MNASTSAFSVRRAAGVVLPLALAAAVFAPLRASAAEVTVASTTVSPSRITSGEEAIQTVTLAEPAPAGGVVVDLLDGNEYEDLTYWQATKHRATVPAGERSVSFPIRVQSATSPGTVTRLTAGVGGSVAETSVTVDPIDARVQDVTSFTVDKRIAVEGSKITGTVKLKSPAPIGGLAVDLRKIPYESAAVSFPYYVEVPAGATSATFAMDVTAYDRPRFATVMAALSTATQFVGAIGVPKKYSIGVLGPVRHQPGNVENFGVVGLGDIWHPFGARINLTSDNPGVRAYFSDLPSDGSIPSDQAGAQFRISVDPSVPAGTKVKLTASWVLGPSPVTTEFTVED
ncbi:hypothetical protein amrb99_00720 [Actinomadura sp. RB99]|uniref:hypothetical protein n=1 Tax=Actinomadura sp. RB99 TaxID=2691577 RepID=UPI00168721C6|nr:hypothetical protein [Actinomadura sp. RB99]MBD2891170.1 hypothetical protein [Actinomadura sp. RB99]